MLGIAELHAHPATRVSMECCLGSRDSANQQAAEVDARGSIATNACDALLEGTRNERESAIPSSTASLRKAITHARVFWGELTRRSGPISACASEVICRGCMQ